MLQLVRENNLIKAKLSVFSLLLAVSLVGQSSLPGQAKEAVAEKKSAKVAHKKSAKPEKADPSKITNLRRVDFRLKGSKCASCLGRIRKRMDKLDAVVEAAVILKKPYGAAAIYDGDKIKVDEILVAALKGEKVKVKIIDVNDRGIKKMPFILVPRFNQLK